MAEKKVEVKVAPKVEDTEIDALEKRIDQLRSQKIQLKLDADTKELEETNNRIETIKKELSSMEGKADVDDSEVKALQDELSTLEGKAIDLELAVEKGKLDSVKAEVEDLDGTTIDVDVNNVAAMEAVEQIGQGFDRLKQGASEVGQQLGTVLEAAGKQETNRTFLEMSVGADQAAEKLQTINSIVQNLPGDDTALQGLLSAAAAKNASLTADELTNMGTAAADYFSAMDYYGKSATEAQQDMTNYILAGNTAELERSPIMQGHIDKLKEATTVQDRINALQEALNAEGWKGMSQQDTYNNKLQTFMGMIDRGKYNLGGMFQEAAKYGMDFVMQLDAASGGLVGMGIAVGGFASPIADTLIGLGQMAQGFKAIKDLGIIKWFKELEIVQKAYAFFTQSQLIPVQMEEGAAGWFSVGWIAVAIAAGILLGLAFIYLYENCEWFRDAVNNLVAALQWLAGEIWGDITSAITWLSDQFTQFTEQLGLNTDDWTQAVLAFILFIPQLPFRVGVELANAIAKALGFKDDLLKTMWEAAKGAYDNFKSGIAGLRDLLI